MSCQRNSKLSDLTDGKKLNTARAKELTVKRAERQGG